MRKLVVGTLLALLLNAAYLFAFESPTLFYVLNVFFHALAGLGAVVVGLVFLLRAFSSLNLLGRVAAVVLVLSGACGTVLLYTGTLRPFYWLLLLHIVTAGLGIVLLVIYLVVVRQRWRVPAAVLLVSLAFPAGVRLWGEVAPDPNDSIVNPILAPLSMEEEGPGPASPFFPSAANTNVNGIIPSSFLMKPESCARSGCHPDIYEQWQSSAHHFSSFNNQWYRKSVEYMQDVVGTQPSKWCAGCHDHAVFFNGRFDIPIREQVHTPEAQRGLTCTSCHAIVAVRSTMGNGDFVIEYPPLHDLAASENRFLQFLHDFTVRLDPGPHRRTFLKPFMREQPAEFCSSCHKVHLDKPVNQYRWFRGFNEYDAWQSSGVSGQGARSFYYPPAPMTCVDCHMPLVESRDAGNIEGFVHSHRFPGANTALPFANRDEKQLEVVTRFLQDEQIRVDIFALSEADPREVDEAHRPSSPDSLQVASMFAEGDELGLAVGRGTGYTEPRKILAPLDRVKPVVRRGDTVRLDVVVRTLNVGHFFPGGTVDAFDVWVELKGVDEEGRVVFWSGYVPEDEKGYRGPVDPGAHFYRSFLLDEHGNPINKRNAWAARAALYVRLIPPGAADTVHYRIQIPEQVGDRIQLTARVNYRKFHYYNTHFSYAGIRDPQDPDPPVGPGFDDGRWIFTGDTSDVSGQLKSVPDLPIVTMAESFAELRVVDRDTPLPDQSSVLLPEDRVRWNDYGIGLLLQGDLKAAEHVFQTVTEVDPEWVEGWVNIGRVRVQEGRTEEAQEVLRKALDLDPGLAKTHFFLGMTYKSQGNYDQALEHLRAAEQKYPRDRVVLNQIGRILFLKRQYQEAVEVLQRVLRIDPEDLQAHYNLMLAYRGLGNRELAAREQQLYLRYKADESAQAITGEYRRKNPHDNNERQAIHEHTTFPLDQIRESVSSPTLSGMLARSH